MRSKQVVFLLASILVWENIACYKEEEENEKSSSSFCQIPSKPKHGSFEFTHVSEEKYMGQPNDFILNVTCDPGYGLVGEEMVSCLAGHWFEEMPECIPMCKKGKHPSVILCDNKENEKECTCFLEKEIITQTCRRQADQDNNPCGIEPLTFAQVVVGGRPNVGRELPWHAAIYTKTTKPYMQICGGTLVSKTAVLSAAHCFWSEAFNELMPKENFAVGLGKLYRPWNNDKDDNAQKFDVNDIKIPPRYRGSATNFQDDIAVVILSSEVVIRDHLKPICLSFDPQFDAEQLKPGSVGKTGGWGLTSEDGKSSPSLQLAELPYIDVGTCITELPPSFISFLTSDKICAGHTNGTAVCKGDSGGGLVFAKDRRYYLRGIVSTAPGSDHLCNVYTWATFTHVQKHEHFIRQFVEFQEPKREDSNGEDFIRVPLK